eukprot:6206592-Pleurochrysis_carterae.AAC.6
MFDVRLASTLGCWIGASMIGFSSACDPSIIYCTWTLTQFIVQLLWLVRARLSSRNTNWLLLAPWCCSCADQQYDAHHTNCKVQCSNVFKLDCGLPSSTSSL